ncbi:hypothetical protein LEP1GSC125_2617 [Leptospira mayottensis 200901122]|uniref:Uncharacterized protein n=1 Tax=Leptospira mayottensis 200901122 TaxID=1193010 RepID=A0AA87MQX7_9LEPT|nr:hypothetical protein LEP1GSC125_2617 [Leptospira mayottensis 200901122]
MNFSSMVVPKSYGNSISKLLFLDFSKVFSLFTVNRNLKPYI